jgi:hypothetical protein
VSRADRRRYDLGGAQWDRGRSGIEGPTRSAAQLDRGDGVFEMETVQLLRNPPGGVPELVWRPVQKAAQLVRQVQQTAERLVGQVRDVIRLVLRALDGVALQTTRVRARSQVEWIVGPLTFSVAGGVIFARGGGLSAE